jgi:hypothetical protein
MFKTRAYKRLFAEAQMFRAQRNELLYACLLLVGKAAKVYNKKSWQVPSDWLRMIQNVASIVEKYKRDPTFYENFVEGVGHEKKVGVEAGRADTGQKDNIS